MAESKVKRSAEDGDCLPDSEHKAKIAKWENNNPPSSMHRKSARLAKGVNHSVLHDDAVGTGNDRNIKPQTNRISDLVSRPETSEGPEEGVLSIGSEDIVSCSEYFMSDELLLKIFSYLPTADIFFKVRRVCKRWRTLSTDPYLWKTVDFSFVCLKPAQVKNVVKNFCHKTTTSIALRGPTNRPESRIFGGRKLGGRVVNKCLTISILKDIKKSCPTLTSFSLSHEQVARLSLCTHLPSTITHLSLPYCNLISENLLDLIQRCPFPQLVHLDLSSAILLGDGLYLYHDNEICLPPTLRSLVLDDTGKIPLFRIIENLPNLTHLSLSYNQLDPDLLLQYSASDAAKAITSLHLRGCLLCPDDYEMRDGDFEDWNELWTRGFPSLKKLDVRNVTLNSANLPECVKPLELYTELLDVDGTVVGQWDSDSLKPDHREHKYNYFDRLAEENRLRREYYDRRYRRRRGWFNLWGDSDEDGYSSDEEDRDRGDCSLM